MDMLPSIEKEIKQNRSEINVFNTETESERKKRLENEIYQTEKTNLSLMQNRVFQSSLKSGIIAHYSTKSYHFYAFCYEQGALRSGITLQIFRKDCSKMDQIKLQPIFAKVTTIKIKQDHLHHLNLLLGTKCGQLLIHKNFQSKTLEITSIKVSSHPISSMIVPKSLYGVVFMLATNGTIYLVDLKEKCVRYQFKVPLPMIQDKCANLFMDLCQNIICCAFGHGRIIIWEITSNIKKQYLSQPFKKQQEDFENQYKNLAKKGGKENLLKKTIFKPLASFISCCKEKIMGIQFLESFLMLITNNNTIKIIAVNLSGKCDTLELFLVLNQYPLLKGQDCLGENDHIEQISGLHFNSQGVIVYTNILTKQYRKFVDCKADLYLFDSHTLERIIRLEHPLATPLTDVVWSYGQPLILFCSEDRQIFFLNKELEFKNQLLGEVYREK